MSWQVLKQEDGSYLLRCLFKDENVVLKISDLVHCWSHSFPINEVTSLFQQQNPLVEAPQESLVKYIKNILDINKSKVKVIKNEDSVKVSLLFTLNFQGILFSLNLKLQLMEPDTFYNDITVPLLLTVQNLQAHKKYLIDQLRKKDLEINEYKLEGYHLSRKNIETVKFDESILSELPLLAEKPEAEHILNIVPQCKIFDELYQLLELKRSVEPAAKEKIKSADASCDNSTNESLSNESDSKDPKRRKFNA